MPTGNRYEEFSISSHAARMFLESLSSCRRCRVATAFALRYAQPKGCGGLPQPQAGRLPSNSAAIRRPSFEETESPEIGLPAINSRIAVQRFSERESAPMTKFAWQKEQRFFSIRLPSRFRM